MNKLIISGNLVKEVEMSYAPGSGTAVLKNTVATRRKIKDKITQKYESDFIPIVAFGKTAEFIANGFIKGQGIQVEAHMQSGSYDNKEGIKVYTLEAIVENVEFLGIKPQSQNQDSQGPNNFGNMNQEHEEDIIPVDDGDMPF